MGPLVVICEMGLHLQVTMTIVIRSTGLLDVDLVDEAFAIIAGTVVMFGYFLVCGILISSDLLDLQFSHSHIQKLEILPNLLGLVKFSPEF